MCMAAIVWHARVRRAWFGVGAALLAAAIGAAPASASGPAVRISSDPFTNPTSQHRTQVEPDTFAFGSTILAAFQTGRFYDGGSSDIDFATSLDAGPTWARGVLPGITGYRRGGFARGRAPSGA